MFSQIQNSPHYPRGWVKKIMDLFHNFGTFWVLRDPQNFQFFQQDEDELTNLGSPNTAGRMLLYGTYPFRDGGRRYSDNVSSIIVKTQTQHQLNISWVWHENCFAYHTTSQPTTETQYLLYSSCYWAKFDQTLKFLEVSCEQITSVIVTFVMPTFALATFILEYLIQLS